MSKHDGIILGGGIIGCALAEELARHGQRVAIIEKGRIGAEASSAAAGILSAQMDVPKPGIFFDFCQDARRAYPAWIRRIEKSAGRRVGYRRSGVLYLAASAAEVLRMQQRAAWQRKQGLPVERWSVRDVRRLEPAVDGAFKAAFHFPLEGQVDNRLLIQALALACSRAGVALHEDAQATRLLIRRGSVYGVETTAGFFQAPIVINTTGSWAGIHSFPVKLPVEPARGQMVSFAGPRRLFRRPVMAERAYVVQRQDGQLLLGSTVERVGFDRSLTVEGVHAILCGARKISSKLDACTFLDGWAGLRPYSRTGYPILGPTAIGGVFVATGHFRHGILLAPVTASFLSELILKGRPSFDLSSFYPR